MANGITFKRDADKVTITVELKAVLAGSTSSGKPGGYGAAEVAREGKVVKLNLNVFAVEPKVRQAVTTL